MFLLGTMEYLCLGGYKKDMKERNQQLREGQQMIEGSHPGERRAAIEADGSGGACPLRDCKKNDGTRQQGYNVVCPDGGFGPCRTHLEETIYKKKQKRRDGSGFLSKSIEDEIIAKEQRKLMITCNRDRKSGYVGQPNTMIDRQIGSAETHSLPTSKEGDDLEKKKG